MTRVLLVEDDGFALMAMSSALKMAGYETFVAESASAGLTVAKTKRPNAAVLDLHLGQGPNGLDLAIELRKLNAGIGLVFLTSYSDPKLLIPKASLPQGSVYLNKAQVRDVEILTRALARALAKQGISPAAKSKFSDLTVTQIETLQLVAEGLSNAEIAKRRFVTEKSVEKMVSRIAKVIGLESAKDHNQRVQLARSFISETSGQQAIK